MMKKNIIFFILTLFLCQCNSFANEVQFTARVDKTYLGQNEYLNYTVEISGPVGTLPSPTLPDLNADFHILSGPIESTSYQFVNGNMSASRSISYTLQPRREGTITIYPATLKYKGEQLKTEAININVTIGKVPPPGGSGQPPPAGPGKKSEPTSPPEKGEDTDVFLRAEPDKTTLVQNEAVIINYRLYFTVDISAYEITKLPNTAGFWVEEFEIPRQPVITQEVVDGQRYQVATIRKVALFPTKPGKLTVEPLEVQCQVRERRRARSRDLFDSFFNDPFFDSAFSVPRYFQSRSLTLNVLPFPEAGKPANFSGAVGNFNLSASIDKESVQTNDPITLTISVSGQGNIKMIPPPQIKISPDFDQYEPEINIQTNKMGGVVKGSKTFKYLLVPRHAGDQTIEPINFSYYNPDSKRYLSLKSRGFQIKVARGKETVMAGPMSVSPEDVKLYGQDISFIKTEGHLKPVGSLYLYRKPGYYLFYILPLLLFAGGIYYYSYLLRRHPGLVRSLNALRKAKSALKQTEKFVPSENTEEFFHRLSEALLDYISDKLNISSASLVLNEVKDTILSRGISQDALANLDEIMEQCNLGRFSVQKLDTEARRKLLESGKKILMKMEAQWKK